MGMNRKLSGVITVYLALILMLLLALITSMLEHARLLTTQNYCNRVLQTAQESMLSDYYLPLFEHYQVFGLHMTEQNFEQKNKALSEKLLSFIQEGENPLEKDLFLKILYPTPGLLLCNPKIQKTSCSELSLLTQNDNFKNQAVCYEKYGLTKEIVEQVLYQSDSFTQVGKAAKLAEKKIETEQELAMIDEQVLSLIQEIEGLKVKNGNIKQTWFLHRICASSSYVKQCITCEPTQESVGINHKTVFQALKPSYVNFIDELDSIRERADKLYIIVEAIETLKREAKKRGETYIGSMEALLSNYSLYSFKNKINEILGTVNHACEIIQTIETQREVAKETVDQYKQEVSKATNQLSSELLSAFEEEYPQMDAYVDKENQSFGMIANLAKMKSSLIIDKEILENVLRVCPDQIPLESDSKEEFYENMEYCKQQLSSYSYDGLMFDYSGIQLERQSNTILSTVQGVVNGFGATFVLPDQKELSRAELTGTDFVSEGAESDFYSEWIDFKSGVSDFFERTFSSLTSLEDIVIKEKLYDRVAFYEYLKSHTTTYQSKEYQRGQVLMYEREYLLYGGLTDLENIQSAAMKLIGTRTGINYIGVLTNPSMRMKAEEFALMTVGFTQLPFLVSFVKYMTLFIWAFEEALVETAALFMGKEIPVVKNGRDFLVRFEELLSISKEWVQQKAKMYSSKKGADQIGYEGYINIFLWLKSEDIRKLRMMDLIQENLRNEYEDSFRMKNCITGFTTDAESFLKQKFLFLPYFKQWKKSYNGYQIMSHQRITY